MKKQLTFLALLFSFSQVNAQCNYRVTLQYNNAAALINVNGFFFRDMAMVYQLTNHLNYPA